MSVSSELARALDDFPSAVLTVIDSDGYPVSIRCTAAYHTTGLVIRPVPGWVELEPGRACLMGHSHNQDLWDLCAVLSRGSLVEMRGTFEFRPETFSRTSGGSIVEFISWFRRARRAAKTYLRRSGIDRPRVPWALIAAAKSDADRSRSSDCRP